MCSDVGARVSHEGLRCLLIAGTTSTLIVSIVIKGGYSALASSCFGLCNAVLLLHAVQIRDHGVCRLRVRLRHHEVIFEEGPH